MVSLEPGHHSHPLTSPMSPEALALLGSGSLGTNLGLEVTQGGLVFVEPGHHSHPPHQPHNHWALALQGCWTPELGGVLKSHGALALTLPPGGCPHRL